MVDIGNSPGTITVNPWGLFRIISLGGFSHNLLAIRHQHTPLVM
jgi:hypothetical protein